MPWSKTKNASIAARMGRTCYAVSHHFDVPCDQAVESCPLSRAQSSGQRQRVLHLHHTPRGEGYVNIEPTPRLVDVERPTLFLRSGFSGFAKKRTGPHTTPQGLFDVVPCLRCTHPVLQRPP